jgi:hypothetical protein
MPKSKEETYEDEELNDIEIDDSDESDEEIEVDENDDLDSDDTETADEDDDSVSSKIVSKHKQSGKHSLQYDTIFKGKKEEVDEDTDTSTTYHNDSFSYDPGSNYFHETMNNHDYLRERELKQKVYDVLVEHTEINFMNNRRKPSKTDFNEYYRLLKTHLKDDNFTNTEMFIELAYYFSDNLFNMFKLLEPTWRDLVIDELQAHIGKTPKNSKDVEPKNLIVDAEIEFYTKDPVSGDEIIVTGVIVEHNHEERLYRVDSYETIYVVHIDDIVQILNNTKFKYNLNKLNNIDFL